MKRETACGPPIKIAKKLYAFCILQNAQNPKHTDVIFVSIMTSVSFVSVHIF
jgi:hypothetical protein